MYCKHTLPIYLLQCVSNINRNRARLTKLQEWCLMCNCHQVWTSSLHLWACRTCICIYLLPLLPLLPLYTHMHHTMPLCDRGGIVSPLSSSSPPSQWMHQHQMFIYDHCLRNSYVPFILSKLFFAHKEKIEARGWLKISTSCLCWICMCWYRTGAEQLHYVEQRFSSAQTADCLARE